MLINELTVYELKRIITPVIQLQPMSRVCSEIGEVLEIPKATREKIQKQEKFRLRYKGFDVFFYSLRWLRGRGPSMSLQFKRPATEWQKRLTTWFGESHKRMDKVCGEVVKDLKTVCLEGMPDIKLTSIDVTCPPDWVFYKEEGRFRITYPSGAYNPDWKQANDISPLAITDEYHSGTWFIGFCFNPGAFVRRDEKTILRENWQQYTNDISESVEAEVDRILGPGRDGPQRKSFEEWSEDMILDLGDEVIPQLPEIWKQIQSEKGNT